MKALFAGAKVFQEFLGRRKEQLSAFILSTSKPSKQLLNQYRSYIKMADYYYQELNTVKNDLKEPDKVISKVLTALNKIPSFNHFFKRHSYLSQLNGSSSPNIDPLSLLNALPDREALKIFFIENSGKESASMLENAFKEMYDQNSPALEIKSIGLWDKKQKVFVNPLRALSFKKRLLYKFDIQSLPRIGIRPSTTDVSLNIGYMLQAENAVGIGVSYKIGLGESIKRINIRNQGFGLRGYLEYKIYRNFLLAGGFEMNYQPVPTIIYPQYINHWSESGLIGITKLFAIRSKVFKTTRYQVLWDFLSYKQRPQTSPLKFRVGYNF